MPHFLNDFRTMLSLTFFQLFEINCKLLAGYRLFHDRCFLFALQNQARSIDTKMVCTFMVAVIFSKLIAFILNLAVQDSCL